jgi:hypothetical protein
LKIRFITQICNTFERALGSYNESDPNALRALKSKVLMPEDNKKLPEEKKRPRYGSHVLYHGIAITPMQIYCKPPYYQRKEESIIAAIQPLLCLRPKRPFKTVGWEK